MLDAAEAERRYARLSDYATGTVAVDDMAEEIQDWIHDAPPPPTDEGSIWGLAEMRPADAGEGFDLVRSAFDYGILTQGQYDALQAELDVFDDDITDPS